MTRSFSVAQMRTLSKMSKLLKKQESQYKNLLISTPPNLLTSLKPLIFLMMILSGRLKTDTSDHLKSFGYYATKPGIYTKRNTRDCTASVARSLKPKKNWLMGYAPSIKWLRKK